MSKTDLKLDWCSHAAARYAVEHWHYSRRMPSGKLVKIGAWERGEFVGVIIFGRGATPEIGKPYGLKQTEICELVRIALREHLTPVSRMIAISLRMLKRCSPGLRLVVSFADTSQGHHGGIYQASGWLCVGSEEYHAYRVFGEVVHPRTLGARYGPGGQSVRWLREHVDRNAARIRNGVKHKYVMPLDPAMRGCVERLAQKYPKRAGSDTSDTAATHAAEGGAAPTPALWQHQVSCGT